MTCLKPVSSCTRSLKRNQERAPAYDSSPRMIPAHCSEDIAPVPESVSRSIRMSSAGIRKTFQSAPSRTARRSSRVVMRSGSTTLIRKGSMIRSMAPSSQEWAANSWHRDCCSFDLEGER